MMLRNFLVSALILTSFNVYSQSSEQKVAASVGEFVSNIKVNGVLRTRYEGAWNSGDYVSRFQVRNARMSLEGKIVPQLEWYIRVDFCDRGSFKFLDGWGRWRFNRQWAVQLGRFRVPFGVDAFRGPGTYYFANRSFIGKDMVNLRQVGFQGSFCGPEHFPIALEAGIFNSSTATDQEVWQKALDYSAKASLPVGNVSISASFVSMKPYDVRMNVWDGAVSWKCRNLLLAGEYQRMIYAGAKGCDDVDAYLAYAVYTIPVNWRPFNQVDCHARFDGMTDHSRGETDDDGLLTVNDAARRRLTVGGAIACNVGKMKGEFMLDYEKYWYKKGIAASAGTDNRVVAELIIKF